MNELELCVRSASGNFSVCRERERERDETVERDDATEDLRKLWFDLGSLTTMERDDGTVASCWRSEKGEKKKERRRRGNI
jgi:hypothetical protein